MEYEALAFPGTVGNLLEPVSEQAPCGEDLEYDPYYMELFIKLTPKETKSVSGTSGSERLESAPEPIRWSEVERDCRRLLERTRDIRLITVLLRCRVQQAQAKGLLEGLALLARLLRTWPDELYPRLTVDGEFDPLPRFDALSALVEQEGLLADIRRLPIASLPGIRLEIRDVERALGIPHPEDAPQPDVIRRQLADFQARGDAVYIALLAALEAVRDIDCLAQQQLGAQAPTLTPLVELLERLRPRLSRSEEPDEDSEPAQVTPPIEDAPAPKESEPIMPGNAAFAVRPRRSIADREDARERIREIRLWFEAQEPSSPVPLLLRQAELLVGKRFSEVAHFLPQDLMEKWDADS